MTTRWLAFVVAAAVAVGAGAWALRLFAPADSAPSRTNTVEPVGSASSRTNTVEPDRGDQTRVVGAYLPPAAPVAAPATTGDRFKLVGVVAPRESVAGSEWVALIAVDDEPARAFVVGATVKGDIVLREVSARGAILGAREGGVRIGLDVLPAPATGMAQVPTAGSGLESPDVPPGHGSKYLPLPPQTVLSRRNPAAGPRSLTTDVGGRRAGREAPRRWPRRWSRWASVRETATIRRGNAGDRRDGGRQKRRRKRRRQNVSGDRYPLMSCLWSSRRAATQRAGTRSELRRVLAAAKMASAPSALPSSSNVAGSGTVAHRFSGPRRLLPFWDSTPPGSPFRPSWTEPRPTTSAG